MWIKFFQFKPIENFQKKKIFSSTFFFVFSPSFFFFSSRLSPLFPQLFSSNIFFCATPVSICYLSFLFTLSSASPSSVLSTEHLIRSKICVFVYPFDTPIFVLFPFFLFYSRKKKTKYCHHKKIKISKNPKKADIKK